MKKFFDLSHTIEDGIVTYKGLAPSGFRLHAVPVKVRRFGTFPVRVYAIVETEAG